MTDQPQFTGELAKIAAILEADGFRLQRGHGCNWPTIEITRPDAPDWEGAWSVVGKHDDEADTAALLMVRAWREWPEWRDEG